MSQYYAHFPLSVFVDTVRTNRFWVGGLTLEANPEPDVCRSRHLAAPMKIKPPLWLFLFWTMPSSLSGGQEGERDHGLTMFQTVPAHLPFDLSRSMLTPFLAYHPLRVLTRGSFAVLDINDSFIAQIIFAWGGIEVLLLRGPDRSDARVTLGGIRELLRGCPRLQSLHMRTDARIPPEGKPEMQSFSLTGLEMKPPHPAVMPALAWLSPFPIDGS